MFTRMLLAIVAIALPKFGGCTHAPATETAHAPPATTPTHTGHVEVNGVRYYYETYGRGEPVLLLHGGLGSIDMLRPLLPIFAAGHEVIGVDLHGHGRTTLGDRLISPTDMGNDLAVILDEVGHDQVDVVGYSMGGAVAFRLAVQHPDRVRRLALVSTGFAQEGFHPELLPMQAQVGAAMADSMKGTPMYDSYMAVAPHPEDFPRLLDRMGEWMRTPYDWSAEVKTLTMPVLLVYGDADMFRLEHVVAFYHLLEGGLQDAGWQREHMSQNRLAILPDLTHYEMFLAPAMAHTVVTFLDGGSRPPSWAEHVEQSK